MLDDAFVAAAPVHEPSAGERARLIPVVEAVGGVVRVARSNLELYLAGVAALVALFLTSVALDRLLG